LEKSSSSSLKSENESSFEEMIDQKIYYDLFESIVNESSLDKENFYRKPYMIKNRF
jgi:hypothetical protein